MVVSFAIVLSAFHVSSLCVFGTGRLCFMKEFSLSYAASNMYSRTSMARTLLMARLPTAVSNSSLTLLEKIQ